MPPLEYCDRMEQEFRTTWQALNLSFDDFIRTTEPRHQAGVTYLAQRIYDAGDIYEGVYEGWYCVGCEAFKQEKDLVDGKCPLHLTVPAVDQGEELLLPALQVPGGASGAFRRAPRVPAARHAAQRNPAGCSTAASKTSRSAAPASRGAFRCRSIPSSVVYVWFDALDQLRVGGRPGHRSGEARTVVARRSARHRQGHHAVPHGHLAGDADERRPRRPAAGVRPRLPDRSTASG